jgi:hypothetical protein
MENLVFFVIIAAAVFLLGAGICIVILIVNYLTPENESL